MSGTTSGGAFRYPYELHTLLQDLDPDVLARLMDRDRALEDYITAAAGDFPFIVVADDGSEDFTSIKTAIESVEAPSAGQGATVIYVKTHTTGTYSDSGAGRVTPQAGAKVAVFAGAPFRTASYHNANNTDIRFQQAWNHDGFETPTTGSTLVSLHGLNMTSGGTYVTASTGGTVFALYANHCVVGGSAGLFPAALAQTNTPIHLVFSDSHVSSRVFLASGSWMPQIRFTNCDVTDLASTGTIALTNSATSLPDIFLDSCRVEGVSDLTIDNGSTGDTATPSKFRMADCLLLVGGSLTLQGIGVVDVSNNSQHTTQTAGSINIQQNNALGFYWISALGNDLRGIRLNVTSTGDNNTTTTAISGHYQELLLNIDNVMAVVSLDTQGFSSRTALTVQRDNCFVVATLRESGGTTTTGVNVSGNNNVILTTGSSSFDTPTVNTGSGNSINGLPPTGAAGGDLGGTYPNPTVPNLIPKTLFDAKGDLIAASAADTAARLAVGTNDQVLTADSAQATGLKWATPSDDIPESLLDAKGDLIVATAADTAARLAVGTNDQVLTADSAQATGVKWATPAVSASTAVSNFLSPHQASFEDATTAAVGWIATDCSIARSTAQAAHGSASLALTKT